MVKLQQAQAQPKRKRFGIKFLKEHHIKWIVGRPTLMKQTGISLMQRSEMFKREFPDAVMNVSLLR